MNQIFFPEVLKIINESNVDGNIKPFSIRVVAWDEKLRKGGKKIILQHACKLKENNSPVQGSGAARKSPRHWENQTMNLVDMDNPGRHPVKIHPRLIYIFNNKFVHY